MDNNEMGFIPRSLDMQERFILWEIDQLVIAVSLIGIGVLSGSLLSGLVIGSLAAWQYGRLKSGKHPRFVIHVMYWWLPGNMFIKTLATPPSHQRIFLG